MTWPTIPVKGTVAVSNLPASTSSAPLVQTASTSATRFFIVPMDGGVYGPTAQNEEWLVRAFWYDLSTDATVTARDVHLYLYFDPLSVPGSNYPDWVMAQTTDYAASKSYTEMWLVNCPYHTATVSTNFTYSYQPLPELWLTQGCKLKWARTTAAGDVYTVKLLIERRQVLTQ